MAERRTAGMTVRIGSDLVGRLTSFERNIEVTEEEVSGSGSTAGDPPIIKELYLPVSVGETGSLGGVALDEAALTAIQAAARTGDEITLEFRREDGTGEDIDCFFTNYSESGEIPNVFRFTSSFRVNDTTPISGS